MRPEVVDWITIPVRGGNVRFAVTKTWADMWHEVGDRLVPSPIVLELREPGAPAVDLTIEVVNHVPRVTGLHFWRYGGDGREVRKKDLALDLEGLLEQTVAIASARAGEGPAHHMPMGLPVEQREAEIQRGMRTVQQARGRSQRVMSREHLQKVAEIYRAQEVGGIEAVADVYNVHRATAARWIAKAREAGVLPREGRKTDG